MQARVLVLGAGFGGLELASVLSDELGAEADVTLIDEEEGFVFGYSKLDLLFGRASVDSVRLPYSGVSKPGVRFVRDSITAIDPDARSVVTGDGTYEADALVIALGAAYDLDATPGLAEAGEYYSVAGAARLAEAVQGFTSGRAIIAVCGAPFKCPPAPSETALLLDEHLSDRGVRGDCEISLVMPLATPVPPSPEASEALLAAFAERGIEFAGESRIAAVDPKRRVLVLDDGGEMPYDLLLGVPKHRAPRVVLASGIAEDGYVPVDPKTLRTRYPGVYAVGDVAALGIPKAGVLAEGAARAVAASLIADLRGEEAPGPYDGRGSCYVEFGAGKVGRVDVDFLSGPKPATVFHPPSEAIAADKRRFGASRRQRWFGG
ncbi:MAG TPA: FAD-dependent oxidoreductase [Solirubrobacterales bacterium]|nr:FAD-dependent oxidoreductase [Solirubrobacterales bacterium]